MKTNNNKKNSKLTLKCYRNWLKMCIKLVIKTKNKQKKLYCKLSFLYIKKTFLQMFNITNTHMANKY